MSDFQAKQKETNTHTNSFGLTVPEKWSYRVQLDSIFQLLNGQLSGVGWKPWEGDA